MDDWTERLSEYLDGELDAATERALDAHLAECASCRGLLDELRRVVAKAAALPHEQPAVDRWSSLRSAIEARQVTALPVRGDAQPVHRRRTLAVSVPQAAAAALLIALGWGGSLWWVRSTGRDPGGAAVARVDTPVAREQVSDSGAARVVARRVIESVEPRSAAGSDRRESRQPVRAQLAGANRSLSQTPAQFADADYANAVADLERLVQEGRSQLDTATVRVLEESLRTVDRALRQARAALTRDPNNSYLNEYLAETMTRKLELLRRAADIVESQTE